MQKGKIERRGSCWLLRYREAVIENGKVTMRQTSKKLATFGDKYRTEKSVRVLADQILTPINAKTARPESIQSVAEFLEFVYLPHCHENKRPSTYKGYREMFGLVSPHLNGLKLKETRTSDIDRVMRAVADSKQRAHTVHRNIKSFLSGAFRFAKRNDLIADNPVRDSVVPRGKPIEETAAYSLEEIQNILAVLQEPARTAVLVAGLTGLRLSEVKGLKWEDFVGDELHVQRSVWSGILSETKTLASRAAVPIIPIVRDALEEHRKHTPTGNGFIFTGNTGKPLRLENVVRREITPALTKAGITWQGWHAFRRGLGTNLNALGVDAKIIQTILRHANVSTTMAFYVKPVTSQSVAAMKKLARAFKKSGAK